MSLENITNKLPKIEIIRQDRHNNDDSHKQGEASHCRREKQYSDYHTEQPQYKSQQPDSTTKPDFFSVHSFNSCFEKYERIVSQFCGAKMRKAEPVSAPLFGSGDVNCRF